MFDHFPTFCIEWLKKIQRLFLQKLFEERRSIICNWRFFFFILFHPLFLLFIRCYYQQENVSILIYFQKPKFSTWKLRNIPTLNTYLLLKSWKVKIIPEKTGLKLTIKMLDKRAKTLSNIAMKMKVRHE